MELAYRIIGFCALLGAELSSVCVDSMVPWR